MVKKRTHTTAEINDDFVSSKKAAIAYVENGDSLTVRLDGTSASTIHTTKQEQLIERISIRGAKWGDAIIMQIQATCTVPRHLCLFEEQEEFTREQAISNFHPCSSCSLDEVAASTAPTNVLDTQNSTIFIFPVTQEQGISVQELYKLLEQQSNKDTPALPYTITMQLELLKHLYLEEVLLVPAIQDKTTTLTQIEETALSYLQEQWGIKSAEQALDRQTITNPQLQQLISLLYKREDSQ